MAFSLAVTLTGYYPVDTPMEGGPNDCRGRKLITLQQHLSDPDTYPYVSVAGDCDAWPDGQRISLPDVHPNAVFRIVDTGGHFHGVNKVIRYQGREPLDVCLDPGTGFGVKLATAVFYPGDDWGGPLCAGASVCHGDGAISFDTVAATPVGVAGYDRPSGTVFVAGVVGVMLATGIVLLA